MPDGTAIAIIQPYSCFLSGYAANNNFLPFITVANGSTDNPYAAIPTYAPVGPFNTQQGNAITFQVDACTIDYMHTQSAINTQGRL